jgi:probable O-glycosylation ligase (exosortase A-associated)
MRDILVAVLVFGSIPFILYRPWLGIIVWSWLGFMNPHRMAWGFITEMPVAYMVALATLVGMLFSREPKRIPWSRESVVLAMFVAWMTITTFFAMYPPLAWEQLEKVAKIQLMIFVAMMLINTRERLHALVWTIALSIGFYGVKGGIFTILQGGEHRVYGPPGTFIGGNNEMGLALAMTVPLMYYLYRESHRAFVRAGLAAAMLLTTLAAFGTQSRGALLAMVAMGAMLWWKSRQKVLMTVLVLMGAGLAFAIMPPEWFERMATIKTFEEDQSARGRIQAWTMAFNMASHRFFGGGFESFQFPSYAIYNPGYEGGHDAHSIFFEVLGEHGFVGLALFLTLGILTWMAASRIRRSTERDPEMAWMATLARMTQVSLVAYASAGAFLGMAYFDYAYNLVLIVIACKAILLARSKTALPAARRPVASRAAAAAQAARSA